VIDAVVSITETVEIGVMNIEDLSLTGIKTVSLLSDKRHISIE